MVLSSQQMLNFSLSWPTGRLTFFRYLHHLFEYKSSLQLHFLKFHAKNLNFAESVDAIELGEFVAFIGKILVGNECYLLVVVECTPVATYPCSNVSL